MKVMSVLNIFLASPSDVAAERATVEDVVASVNKSVGPRLGWFINLYKWEDTAPGFGRPQTLINPKVDECDLFVGILWERWGQPTGDYSSGFEEEFERARARRKARGEPEIWLIFKNVNRDKLEDPGDQLKRVLEFRRSQIQSREVLFKDIRGADDLKTEFHSWLIEHILDLPSPAQAAPQQPASAASVSESPHTSVIESSSQKTDQGAVPQQLRTLSALLSKTLQGRVPTFFATHGTLLQEFDVARLHLLSATLMSHRYTGEVLATHDINLIYKHRDQLDATSNEFFLLLRTVVEDTGDVKPGWFWLQGTEEEIVRNVLFDLANHDSSADVRARAVDLLAAARIELPKELQSFLPLYDDSFRVRQSAFNYLATQGDDITVSFLEQMAQGDDPLLSSVIQDARFEILARLHPERAVSEVIEKGEYISEDRLRSLLASSPGVDEKLLLKGTESSWEPMRRLFLIELGRRGKLRGALAQKFAADPSLQVRAIAYENLAAHREITDVAAIRNALTENHEGLQSKHGLFLTASRVLGGHRTHPPDVDAIIVTFYQTLSTEDLLAAVDWFSVDGHLAYRVLALDRFDSVSTDLRSDLANGFRRIKQESLKRLEQEFGLKKAERAAGRFEELDEFIRSQFTKAALLGLAKNGQPSDLEFARQRLTDADRSVRDVAVTVVSRLGNLEDVSALMKIANEDYGDVRQQAAAGALKLSSTPLAVARELMLSKSPEVVRVAFDWMFTQDSVEVRKIFEELLNDGNEANRVRSLYYFSKWLQSADLEELLMGHINKDNYFYNVVTWLDRLLYAPSPLRDMFAKDLERKATGNA